jgi:hypothetical protein
VLRTHASLPPTFLSQLFELPDRQFEGDGLYFRHHSEQVIFPLGHDAAAALATSMNDAEPVNITPKITASAKFKIRSRTASPLDWEKAILVHGYWQSTAKAAQ